MSAKQSPGSGRVVVDVHGADAVFSELSYCYPLKLLSPRVVEPTVAIAYVLTYGGGLVSGDAIHLRVDVGSGVKLLLLTQGSTKVFKRRLGISQVNMSSVTPSTTSTEQILDVSVASNGVLLLLPDPVTCFSKASYKQRQVFRLDGGASIAMIDWITAGRMSRGEEWEFSKYSSINEVWVNGRRIARDAQLLEESTVTPTPFPRRTLKDRLGLFSCYATLILHGHIMRPIIASFSAQYSRISVLQQMNPPDLTWSFCQLDEGCIIRVAGKETELVKLWLKGALNGLEDVVGKEVNSKAFL